LSNFFHLLSIANNDTPFPEDRQPWLRLYADSWVLQAGVSPVPHILVVERPLSPTVPQGRPQASWDNGSLQGVGGFSRLCPQDLKARLQNKKLQALRYSENLAG